MEHAAYWCSVRNVSEARYLVGIVNSETCRVRVEELQAKEQGGARHFDNLVRELRILIDSTRKIPVHAALAAHAAIAETVAAAVPLTEDAHFTRHRRAIRDALAAHEVAKQIDGLVATLLDG